MNNKYACIFNKTRYNQPRKLENRWPFLCVCVCVLAIKAQPETFVNRSGWPQQAPQTRPVAVPVPSAPLRLWPQKVAAQHKWCLSARALSSPCALWLSLRLCESLYRVSIGSLSGLLWVLALSESALAVDLLPLMLPKVPPTWLVTEMRQMTNDLKFIIAARSLCSQTQTDKKCMKTYTLWITK